MSDQAYTNARLQSNLSMDAAIRTKVQELAELLIPHLESQLGASTISVPTANGQYLISITKNISILGKRRHTVDNAFAEPITKHIHMGESHQLYNEFGHNFMNP